MVDVGGEFRTWTVEYEHGGKKGKGGGKRIGGAQIRPLPSLGTARPEGPYGRNSPSHLTPFPTPQATEPFSD
jgi:hypothetical protein